MVAIKPMVPSAALPNHDIREPISVKSTAKGVLGENFATFSSRLHARRQPTMTKGPLIRIPAQNILSELPFIACHDNDRQFLLSRAAAGTARINLIIKIMKMISQASDIRAD